MRILRPWPLDSGVRARWIALIWTGLFVVLSVITQAQNNYCVNPQGAAQGGFTLEKDKVCLGDPVRITASSPNVVNVGYNFNYDGKGLPTAPPNTTNVYTSPGSYTILQYGSGGGAGTATIFCKVVTVLPRNPIKFTAKPCAGRQVTVNVELDASTGQYDNFIINWGDGQNSGPFSRTDIVNPQTHTYTGTITNPTIYILGTYNAPANCGLSIADARTTQQTVTLTSNASAPIINELTTTGDNAITIRYQATGTVQLLQKDASGIFAPNGQTGTGSGTFTVQTNTKQVQCFQIQNQDACSNTTTSKSDQVCSLVLDAKAASKQNNLSWPAYSGSGSVRRYSVSKGGIPIGSIINSSASSYPDNNDIKCGVQYCYSIEATVTGTAQATVKSNQACVTGIDNEPAGNLGDVYVSVVNNRPEIRAIPPASNTPQTSYTMTFSRATSSSGPFQVVGTTNSTNVFVDQSADASAGSYCYQVTYQTACGQVSAPSPPVCTVFLTSQSASGIDWTIGSPFAPATVDSYSLEIVDSLNNSKREISMGGNTHYEPDPADPTLQSQRYRVVAVSSTGVVSYSNFFTFRRDPKILVPDAFTPNGDGTNDTFLVKGIYVDQFRMTIFSRWGEPIFTTDDRTRGWDGTINGQLANAGQYMYRVEVVDLTNQKTVRTGALLLIR